MKASTGLPFAAILSAVTFAPLFIELQAISGFYTKGLWTPVVTCDFDYTQAGVDVPMGIA